MNVQRKIVGIISMFMILIFCVGCGTVKKSEKTTKQGSLEQYSLENYRENINNLNNVNKLENGEKVIIGVSMDSLRLPIWKKQVDFFVSRANELGAQVRIEQANGDDNVQLSQIDKLIAEGVNVLVVIPHDGEICAAATEKAHDAGIKIMAYDRLIKNSDVDLYLGIDNYKVGQLQAEELLKKVSSGNIAYIGGSPSDNNALLFRAGALEVLNKHKDSINIVMDEYSVDWKSEDAYNNLMKLLNKSTDIQGVLCANDATAFGAITALEKFNLSGKIPVTGLDAELSACQRIVEGTQLMTIYKPINEIAYKAAELAVDMAENKEIDANNSLFNGKTNVPSYFIDPVVVTKENMMDTVIKDNFNSFEDVYKNIPEDQRPKQ